MAEPYRTRLSVLFAADASKAVILRRGPRNHFRLIAWDTAKDRFAPGQWMRGVVKLCDLSPKGERLIYWAAQYHFISRAREEKSGPYAPTDVPPGSLWKPRGRRKIPRYMRPLAGAVAAMPRRIQDTWTAVSAPPYFTALALWPAIGTWTGGGIFRSEREIVLREPSDGLIPAAGAPIPDSMVIRSINQPEGATGAFLRSAYCPTLKESEQHAAIAAALTEAGARWLDWISLKRGDDMLFAAGGCIYCLERWASVAPTDYLGKARLLADFRDMSFEPISPPDAATQW